ncbi:MAG: 50S ribosomal protein L18 [Candidatus Omnitrophota bacterium]|nr:MAG: 50S ribosomal protein L18 [Candidatus Omnitrophota bacterium]
MTMKVTKSNREKRHIRIRKKIVGTQERPRLCVFKSNKHIYAQAIDDLRGHTIAAASSLLNELPEIKEEELSGKKKVAKAVGKLIAQRLSEKGIEKVVFDRGGFLYHGRIAALADGARDGGLKF